MKKMNKWIALYLKWISPIAMLAATLSVMGISGDTLLFDIIGWPTIIWILFFVYLVFITALTPKLRDKFVRWLSGIKENDERETQLTGLTSKKTFIFMTGILTLLLFLSLIRVDIYQRLDKLPDGQSSGEVNLAMALRFIESPADPTTILEDSQRNYFVKYRGLPFTADGTLIIVMILQVGAFYYFSRKSEAAA